MKCCSCGKEMDKPTAIVMGGDIPTDYWCTDCIIEDMKKRGIIKK